jgi:hypothetical protein
MSWRNFGRDATLGERRRTSFHSAHVYTAFDLPLSLRIGRPRIIMTATPEVS